jgi:S-adenosylmethionine:tRNA-ribosyltransferase-isomerase (queuine synthetase)
LIPWITHDCRFHCPKSTRVPMVSALEQPTNLGGRASQVYKVPQEVAATWA